MKAFKTLLTILILIMLSSCSAPNSKEAYLDDFESFIESVESDYTNYSRLDWSEADEKFDLFSNEWYYKFENDLSIADEISIKGLEARYYIYKAADGTFDFYGTYLKNDFEELREDLEYYIENDMDEDLDVIIESARQAGDSAVIILNRIIKDIEEKR